MSNPTNDLILDFINPETEMLQKDGEDPCTAIIAVIPTHSEMVESALLQIQEVLLDYMDPDDIILLQRDSIELTNGTIIELQDHSIFFSLSYPTVPGRIFEVELAAPKNATIH